MASSTSYIAFLLLKKISQELSEEEAKELEAWRNSSDAARQMYEALTDKASLQQMNLFYAELQRQEEKRDESTTLATLLARESKPAAHRVHFLRKWGWAAAIIFILGAGAYLYISSKGTQQALVKAEKNISPDADILPGSDKAILTLADGSTIILDSAATGAIARQGNANVVKLANGEIRYDLQGISPDEMMMNNVSTPRGGQYKLTLPDGTQVWLNAASSITYPAAFAAKNRKVKITGEVYMEVAQNKAKPFVVDVNDQSTIQVLGTSFNIHAYADEAAIKTTLVEGSVKVSKISDQVRNDRENKIRNEKTVVLKAGQQAVVEIADQTRDNKATSDSAPIQVQPANISQALAWKNGAFNFNGLTVREVLNQLSRWYDIDIRFEGKEPAFKFMGGIYRSAGLSEVLNMLGKLNLKYRMEGKTLIVL
ncbi:MAG: FecR family protein [Pseudobacter sp.]|uniref:FecR family protein n=1 Tax=Pseudobacter sp. TaxID=2045420 RepID=UPI003F8207BB